MVRLFLENIIDSEITPTFCATITQVAIYEGKI